MSLRLSFFYATLITFIRQKRIKVNVNFVQKINFLSRLAIINYLFYFAHIIDTRAAASAIIHQIKSNSISRYTQPCVHSEYMARTALRWDAATRCTVNSTEKKKQQEHTTT